MAVEFFFMNKSPRHAKMCRTWGSKSGPLACQADALPIELPRFLGNTKVTLSVVCKHYSLTNPLVTDEPEHYCKKFLLLSCFKVGWEFS